MKILGWKLPDPNHSNRKVFQDLYRQIRQRICSAKFIELGRIGVSMCWKVPSIVPGGGIISWYIKLCYVIFLYVYIYTL